MKDALRQHGYLPMLFDFEEPAGRDLTETITTLARVSRLVMGDITDPRNIPQGLAAVVPDLPRCRSRR